MEAGSSIGIEREGRDSITNIIYHIDMELLQRAFVH